MLTIVATSAGKYISIQTSRHTEKTYLKLYVPMTSKEGACFSSVHIKTIFFRATGKVDRDRSQILYKTDKIPARPRNGNFFKTWGNILVFRHSSRAVWLFRSGVCVISIMWVYTLYVCSLLCLCFFMLISLVASILHFRKQFFIRCCCNCMCYNQYDGSNATFRKLQSQTNIKLHIHGNS